MLATGVSASDALWRIGQLVFQQNLDMAEPGVLEIGEEGREAQLPRT
jgi:hypothetical protein